jgi:ABC-type multidrug transport system permease subunit
VIKTSIKGRAMVTQHIIHPHIEQALIEEPIVTYKFSQKNVTYSDAPLFFPEGYETIFLLLYFVTLPYIAGFMFLFMYVSKANIDVFLAVYKNSFFILTWAIGYEIIAALALLWIAKMAIGFGKQDLLGSQKPFCRP